MDQSNDQKPEPSVKPAETDEGALGHAAKEFFWDKSGLNHFKGVIRSAWARGRGTFIAVGIIALALGAVAGYRYRDASADVEVEAQKGKAEIHHRNWESERGRNEDKGHEITRLTLDLNRVTAERDAARDRLVKWETLAASLNPDDPPSKRLDLLFDQMQSLTNILKYLDPSAVAFDLFINSQIITNDQVLVLPRDRVIQIRVRNEGELTAENLTISFLSYIAPTNLLSEGWGIRGGSVTEDAQELPGMTHWMVTAQFSVASKTMFSAPPLVLSTNVAGSPFARIQVHANRSKAMTRVVQFRFSH